MPEVNLDQVMPISQRIQTMYNGQISDTSSLKRIFNTNIGYSRVPFPMMPVEGQDLANIPAGEENVKLNLNARFFWEDLPYGLVILKDIGNIMGVATPMVTRNIIFHQKITDKTEEEIVPSKEELSKLILAFHEKDMRMKITEVLK